MGTSCDLPRGVPTGGPMFGQGQGGDQHIMSTPNVMSMSHSSLLPNPSGCCECPSLSTPEVSC